MASRIRITVAVLSILVGSVVSTPARADRECEQPASVPAAVSSQAAYADTAPTAVHFDVPITLTIERGADSAVVG